MIAFAFACAGLLCGHASSASAAEDVWVDVKCEGTATWQVTISLTGASFADRSIDSVVCKQLHARVEDDGNFDIETCDCGFSGSYRLNLFGAGVTGSTAFVGVATGADRSGPVVIANAESLSATLAGANAAAPSHQNEVHTPNGSCGPNCYRTRVVWNSVN
ncbi:MAG: hypothetical protein M3340_08320 [Actinomycetota bacterium]|nr:hypothetical protein [Actinomycetota bacterium]